MFFADPSALQGSLVETLKDVRPTFFFSVPRVWEKIDEKLKEVAAQNGWLATKICKKSSLFSIFLRRKQTFSINFPIFCSLATWAKSMGA